MSISAKIVNHVIFSGDQSSELAYDSGELAESPALQELLTLAVGDNTIDVPSTEDFTLHGVAFVPPVANDVEFRLCGAVLDTGIQLSATHVSIIHFGSAPPSAFVLNVAEELVGLRLVWF